MSWHAIDPLGRAARLCVLLLLATAATEVVGQPKYAGPLPSDPNAASASAYTRQAVDGAYQILGTAFDAVRRGDTRRAQRLLSDAESHLERTVSGNPNSRDAAVALGVIYFYQGYYGRSDRMKKAVAYLTGILEVDPYADQAARYLANAYANLGDGRSVIYYTNYVDAVSSDVALRAEMATLRKQYQDVFLGSWNDHTDYYNTEEARITEFNKKTFRNETVLAITPEYEQQLGANGLQQVTDGATFYNDPATRDYLQGLVNKLVFRSPGGPPFNQVVDVVYSDEVNAMALPGRIVVNTGLLAFVDSEAELVAVLAHEIAHVYAHHAARKTVADMKNRKVFGALLSTVKVRGELNQKLLNMGIEAGLDLLRRGYNRGQEAEADRMGTHIAYNAGYNPTFMSTFFVKLYQQNPGSPPKLLATHPATDDRINYTTHYLELFPLDKEMQIDSREFQEMRTRLASTY